MQDWHSAHVYYYSPQKDTLILDAVRPLLAAVGRSSEVSQAYFVRHWLRGPHIRVHVRTTPSAWRHQVQPLIAEVIGGYLRTHPSTSDMSEERELPVHRRLADLELEDGPLTPWYPDNSVQYLPYDKRLHVLRTEESAALLADFHVDTTPLAFAALDHVRRGANRLEVPLALAFATAARGCPPIDKGFISYRSHAEGFLANSSDPDGLRTRFERAYRSNAGAVTQLLTEVLTDIETGQHEVPFLADWIRIVDTYQRRAGDLNDAGGLALAPIEVPPDPPESGAAAPVGKNVSAFHRALFGDSRIRETLNGSPWFAVYRVLLNYQYLLFNRLGLVPVERFLLCYLVARTVEEAYDISIPDFIDPGGLLPAHTAAPRPAGGDAGSS